MGVEIHNLIAAINPDLYCKPELRSKVKDAVKNEGYLKAAEIAEPVSGDFMDIEESNLKNPFSGPGLSNPIEKHTIEYEASSESLERIYFWILDTLKSEYGKTEKIADNFISSPGSAHFSEMEQRATKMQEEAMRIFVTVNNIIKSILNIIYDLKEFKLRLSLYDDMNSKDKNLKQSARLSLKQIWLDSVDIKRGSTSIQALAKNFDYATLIDGFMIVEDENLKNGNEEIDLNDRVKRILRQRIVEFNRWVAESEKELRKRYEIEKIYLKSQVNSVKLYSRWVKPYLKAARALEQRANPEADLVSIFNTSLFELSLLTEGKYNFDLDIQKGDLPIVYKKMIENKELRRYSPCLVVEIFFRAIPERMQYSAGYGFRGGVKADFTSYSLNEDELKVLRQELEKDDMKDAFGLIEGMTEESLEHIQADLDEILEEKKEEKKEESRDINPFSALFDFLKTKKKEEKKDLSKGVEKDSAYEKPLRARTIIEARRLCRKLYDSYKKGHNMPVFHPN